MASTGLKSLLDTLSAEEQSHLILTYYKWANQEMLFGVQRGIYQIPAENLAELAEVPPETIQLLNDSVANGDKNKSLRIGVTDIFRGLAIMQSDATGPQLNTYFKAHLPEHVFQSLYVAAGLAPHAIKLAVDFPTEPINFE